MYIFRLGTQFMPIMLSLTGLMFKNRIFWIERLCFQKWMMVFCMQPNSPIFVHRTDIIKLEKNLFGGRTTIFSHPWRERYVRVLHPSSSCPWTTLVQGRLHSPKFLELWQSSPECYNPYRAMICSLGNDLELFLSFVRVTFIYIIIFCYVEMFGNRL